MGAHEAASLPCFPQLVGGELDDARYAFTRRIGLLLIVNILFFWNSYIFNNVLPNGLRLIQFHNFKFEIVFTNIISAYNPLPRPPGLWSVLPCWVTSRTVFLRLQCVVMGLHSLSRDRVPPSWQNSHGGAAHVFAAWFLCRYFSRHWGYKWLVWQYWANVRVNLHCNIFIFLFLQITFIHIKISYLFIPTCQPCFLRL